MQPEDQPRHITLV